MWLRSLNEEGVVVGVWEVEGDDEVDEGVGGGSEGDKSEGERGLKLCESWFVLVLGMAEDMEVLA